MTPTLRAALDAWRKTHEDCREGVLFEIDKPHDDCSCDLCAAYRAALALLRAAGEVAMCSQCGNVERMIDDARCMVCAFDGSMKP